MENTEKVKEDLVQMETNLKKDLDHMESKLQEESEKETQMKVDSALEKEVKHTLDMKAIANIKNPEELIGELTIELQDEYKERVKSKIKQKMKEIAMTKDILVRQEKELSDMLEGKLEILSKEEYLFG